MTTLEEIRLLSNLETSHSKLMQIVLFGQPELDAHLALPNMRQLKDRITHSFYLLPLPNRDVKDYLDFRLRAAGYKGPALFDAACIDVISEASEGLTRRINIYADKALLAAYAEGTHTVTANHVRAAVSDTVLKNAPRVLKISPWIIGGVALLVGLIGGFLLGRATAPAPALLAVPAPAPTRAASIVTPTPVAPVASPPAPIQPAENALNTGVSSPPTIAVATPKIDATQGSADWLNLRVSADRKRLDQQAPTQIVVQLMTATKGEAAALENYLRQLALEVTDDKVFVTITAAAVEANSKTNVLLGGFTDQAAANAQLARLSPRLRQYQPYLRTFGSIQKEVLAVRPGNK